MKKVVMTILDKVDFRTKNIIWDKERNFMIKQSTHQEDITILNVCT